MSKPKRKIRWWGWLLIVIGVIVVGIFAAIQISSEPFPKGTPGPEADAMAQKMFEAIDKAAWDTTEAVSWTFAGTSGHQHLWDRKRHFAQVKWDKYEVLVDINARSGKAYQDGFEIGGEEADQLVNKAWEYWVNDSFWLNAPAKAFDPGTTRSLVNKEDGQKALLVAYGKGGVTPGDAYLWTLDESGMPSEWKMWVKIIPVGGMAFDWSEWITLPTGAKIATVHHGPFTLKIDDVKGAATLAELTGTIDPFAAIAN